MTAVQKPSTPRTPRQGTPRGASTAYGEIDPKMVQLVWTSLKDRIYQRSHNLRHTYRELDAAGNGMIPIDAFVEEMGRAYQLSPLERHCLRLLLQEADFRRDGVIDFREFCEMLKVHDKSRMTEDGTALSQQEKRRFDRCVMDKKMQAAVMADDSRTIRVIGGMPTNELGPMQIDCPYGVLGDSERMDAVIASFLDIKYDKLRDTFKRFDVNGNGKVSYAEFREGMKDLDHYVFDDEIDNLIAVLDRKKKGYILIDDFVKGLGKEYLKKKAHRSQAHESPFQWPVVEKQHKTNRPSSDRSPRAEKRHAVPPCRLTRASELRANDAKLKLHDIFKREDGNHQARVVAGTAGTSIPKPPPQSPRQTADGSTPRLPSITARGAGNN